MWSPTADTIAFSTAGNERARIDVNGNLGVGTVTPGTLLQVNGDITTASGGAVADAGGALQFRIGALSTYSPMSQIKGLLVNGVGTELQGGIGFSTRPLGAAGQAMTERVRITAAGSVGINETAPDYLLDVNGAIGFTPGASVTPVDNGDVVFELTNNTTLTVKAKGSDGVVRSATLTLA
jgi:hypothetical protein